MEGLFRQIGIYNPDGQEYTPEDRGVVSYSKRVSGQVLQEGINERLNGILVATAASYSTNDLRDCSTFSMFGFQRVGDMAWMAGINKLVVSYWVQPQAVRH